MRWMLLFLMGCEGFSYTVAETCSEAVTAAGHDEGELLFCDGHETDTCAIMLVEAGYEPVAIVHCTGVNDLDCAREVFVEGRSSTELVFCN